MNVFWFVIMLIIFLVDLVGLIHKQKEKNKEK